MSLEKIIAIDMIQVVENNCAQIRVATKILDNGIEINRTFHRHVIAPGDDYSAEDDRVKAVCAALHTPEVIAAYQAMLEANRVEAISEAAQEAAQEVAQEAVKPAALEV